MIWHWYGVDVTVVALSTLGAHPMWRGKILAKSGCGSAEWACGTHSAESHDQTFVRG
jgi:hypothetical protein